MIPSHWEWQSQVQVVTCVLVSQTCSTLCDIKDCSLPGSSVHGIFQQEYWKGLPFPSPGDLPNPGVQPGSPALPPDPSLGSVNLLEWLTELRKTFHLLDQWFLVKDYNSGQLDGRNTQGKLQGEGMWFHPLSRRSTLPKAHGFPSPEALWNLPAPTPTHTYTHILFYGGFIA